MGPTSSYAVKRIMQLSGMHLSGAHCICLACPLKYTVGRTRSHAEKEVSLKV